MGQGGGCSVPERLCDADGNAVLFVLDGTRWGELGTGWLGCKPRSADQIDRMLQNRRHHPFPPSGAFRSGACLGLFSRYAIALCDLEVGAVPKHGVHDDGEPLESDTRLAHG
jgi:hypothetical protein